MIIQNFWECRKYKSFGRLKNCSPTTTSRRASTRTTGGPRTMKPSHSGNSARSFIRNVTWRAPGTTKHSRVRSCSTRFLRNSVYLCDHEQAFSFVSGVIGWQPPWTGQGLTFYRNHVFYQLLTGLAQNWDRLRGALDALTDGRLNEYLTTVPNEWKTNNAANRIADYLSDARQNREALFTVITRLLQ